MARLFLLLVPIFLLAACGTDGDGMTEAGSTLPGDQGSVSTAAATFATARLDPLGESAATGTVTFTATDEGLRVEYNLVGIELGNHGFHVHENGACGRGDDGTPGGAAGGHFNPLGAPHGSPEGDRETRHVGDLGNVTSEAGGVTGGVARGEFVDPLISLAGPTSILDRAVVLHQGEDDLTSQPSGAAGDRIACGVVQLAVPPNDI
ncbi:MAG: superoxide dismutase family protein [Bacteroidota bacterium]